MYPTILETRGTMSGAPCILKTREYRFGIQFKDIPGSVVLLLENNKLLRVCIVFS